MKNLLFLLLSFPIILTAQVEEGRLLSQWSDSTLVASRAHNNTYNEVWGIASNGREYAVIGSTKGTHIIDVTDPESIDLLFTIDGGTQGTSIIHRDYHHYECYLYAIADEGGSSTLQIIDISSLPEKIEVVYDNADIVRTAHNMFIDSSRAKLYFLAVSGTNGRSAMQIFDLKEDPLNPKFLGAYSKFGNIQASHVHDAFIQNDTAYLNCGNQGFAVVDFSDTKNPVTIATMRSDEYPNSGYNHSGWISTSGSHYYLADENHGSPIKVVELSDMDNMHVSKQFSAESKDNNSIAHNPIVACDYLYISYYYDGLQVYDISDPANPERVMSYPTSILDNDSRYRGAWGVYPFLPSGNILVSDMQNGLFVLEGVQDGTNCEGITTCTEITSITNSPFFKEITFNYSDNEIRFSIDERQNQNNVINFRLINLDGISVQYNSIATLNGVNDYSVTTVNSIIPGIYIVELELDNQIYIGRMFIQQ